MKQLPISSRHTTELYALVSDEDYERVRGYTWCVNGNGYVCRFERGTTYYLHKMILPEQRVHFVNGNRLDCRRENLAVGWFTHAPRHGNGMRGKQWDWNKYTWVNTCEA